MLSLFSYLALLLAIAFLLVPVTFDLRTAYPSSRPRPRLRLDVAFSFGLFGVSLHLFPPSWRLYLLLLGRPLTFAPVARSRARALPPPPPSREKALPFAPEEERPRPKKRLAGRIEDLADRAKPFTKPILNLLRSAVHAFKLKKMNICACFGLNDPARTGMVFGYLQMLECLRGKRIRLDLTPDFTAPGVRGRIDLAVRLHLGYLLLLVLRFLFQASFRWLVLRLPWFPWRPGYL